MAPSKQPSLDASSLVHDTDLRAVLTTTTRLRAQALHLLDLQKQLLLATTPSSSNGDGLPPSSQSAPAEIAQLKQELSLAQTKMLATNARLRAQHRAAVMSTRTTKALTSEARQEVDGLSLMLQNLVYEQRHLKSEIIACESYDHSHFSLPLIPESEFLELFPDKGELSEHDLMIARIEHELQERTELEENRQGLLKRKQALIAENKKRKEDLANLDKDLEKFIDAAGPIIRTFESRGD